MSKFTLRTFEQMGIAGAVAFLGALAAGDGSLTKGVLSAAIAAGLRAVYGAFVRTSGEDKDSPSVN